LPTHHADGAARDHRRSGMNEGTKKFSLGLAIGVAVGTLIYRFLLG
jgi:hypothetical protein